MKKLLIAFAFLVSAAAYAGNSTLVYTADQSQRTRDKYIPRYNKAHCEQFRLPKTCTSADLVAAGCVVKVYKSNKTGLAYVIDSCTIFTTNGAGEEAYLQETKNQELAATNEGQASSDSDDFCVAFKAKTNSEQNAICASLSLPNGCNPCQSNAD